MVKHFGLFLQPARGYLFFLVALFTCPLGFSAAHAQQAVSTHQPKDSVAAWVISYGPLMGVELMDSMRFPREKQVDLQAEENEDPISLKDVFTKQGPVLEAYVTDSLIRVESNSFLSSLIYLLDKKDSMQLVLDTSTRVAYKALTSMPQVTTVGDSIVVADPLSFGMLETDFKDTTLGLQVQLVQFKVGPDSMADVVEVWYAPDIPILYWDKYGYLKRLKGAPLAMGYRKQTGFLGIVATKVQKKWVPLSLFKLPEDYQVEEFL